MLGDVSGLPVPTLYTCAINTFDVFEEFTFGRLITRSWQFGRCVISDLVDGAIAEGLGIGKLRDVITTISDAVEGFHECYRTEDEPIDRDNTMTEVYFDELVQVGNALKATTGIFTNLFGDETWLYEPNLLKTAPQCLRWPTIHSTFRGFVT